MINRHTNDYCGGLGKSTEEEIKELLGLLVKVARPGRTDMRKNNICYEVKTGAGELGNFGEKLVKGSSMVVYIPVVDEAQPLQRQEGFVMRREVFLQILDDCGMIREKISTAGVKKVTIQTFWNRKLNKPHGRGLQKMLDAFYDSDDVETLEAWLEELL